MFSPSRNAAATLCRRTVPKSRSFLSSSRGHSSHSFKNRRYLVADIFGYVLHTAQCCERTPLRSLTFIGHRAVCYIKIFPLLLRARESLTFLHLPVVRVVSTAAMPGSESKKGTSGVMDWVSSACRFATDRNDFRRLVSLSILCLLAG